jgi:hypothetical protein
MKARQQFYPIKIFFCGCTDFDEWQISGIKRGVRSNSAYFAG